MVRLPKKLEKDTIIDSIFEVRFSSNSDAVSSILLGLLFQKYRSDYKKIERLGPSQMPAQIVENDENLRYAHHYRLVGDQYSLSIGNHVASINCTKPYAGWSNFKPKIIDLLSFLESTSLIDKPERFSIKYINVIPTGMTTLLNGTKVGVQAGDFDLTARPLSLRAEILKGDFVNVIQVSTGISATTSKNEQVDGILLDIDTIYTGTWQNFWVDMQDLLEKAHIAEKEVFFGLLTEDMIDSLKPQY